MHDINRQRAVSRMRRALAETVLLGLPTNLPFLRAVVEHPEFVAGRTPVDFIARHLPDWKGGGGTPGPEVMALAAMAEFARLGVVGGGIGGGAGRGNTAGGGAEAASSGGEPNSPWRALGPFRMGGDRG